jgi:hypothetical protein
MNTSSKLTAPPWEAPPQLLLFCQTLSSNIKYNLEILVNNTEAMDMKEKMNVRTKIMISNHIIGQENILIT